MTEVKRSEDDAGRAEGTESERDSGAAEGTGSSQAAYGVGQLVHHRLFDYRGVVFDADATFQGSDAWYENVARSRPPRDAPWYHVLVDGAQHTTYVAERNLEPDPVVKEIVHPLIGQLFTAFEDGIYRSRRAPH